MANSWTKSCSSFLFSFSHKLYPIWLKSCLAKYTQNSFSLTLQNYPDPADHIFSPGLLWLFPWWSPFLPWSYKSIVHRVVRATPLKHESDHVIFIDQNFAMATKNCEESEI